MKVARQRALADLLRSRDVESQVKLTERLRALGFSATQATVSRDLEELGAYKVRTADGRLVYSLPDGGQPPVGDEEVRSMLALSLLDAVPAGNLVVLRTPPGHANVLGATLDRARMEGVAGTLAGDDTVLVVCTDRRSGKQMAGRLLEMARGHRAEVTQ